MVNFYLKLKRSLTAVLVLSSSYVFSQTQVTGTVVASDDGTGLPGVSILEKGTTNGTVSGSDGKYSINVTPNATLTFSFIGYSTYEVRVDGKTQVDVSLEPNISALDEVVVIGYGQQEKKDVTGAVQALASRDFNKGVISSPQDMMVGRIAGVQVTSNSGAPGGASTIRIRGSSSIGGSQDPLIVIDGFPVDNTAIAGQPNAMATLNPQDIETFTVLKDAAATAIYGLRASNGVIIITTKKGKEGKPQLSYNGNVSVSTPIKYVDVLSGNEMRATANDLLQRELPGLTSQAIEKLGDENTDWQKEIYQNAISHDHNISLSGAYKNLPYRISYGYTAQEGVLKTTDFVRNSLNINLTPEFLDGDLRVTASLKGSFTKQNFGNTGAVGAAVAFDPTQPVKNGSSRWGGYFAWVGPASATELDPNGDPITIATDNPVAMLEQTNNVADVYRTIASLQLDYRLRFFPAVKLTMNTGIDYSKSTGQNDATVDAAFTYENGGGQRIDYTGITRSRLFDFYANYTKSIGKSKFDITAGHSYQAFERDGSNFARNALTGNDIIYTDYQTKVVDGETIEIPREYVGNPNYLLSFFGRMNYALNDKYLLTVSFRDDASSRFSEENRWKIFPAAAIGWQLSKEPFLASAKVISDMKLRASYGITGNQDISDVAYPYLSTYQVSSSTSQYQFGDTFYNTYRPQPYDADLRWETTEQVNIGMDFGLFNNRLTGVLDFYHKNTVDLINRIPVPAGSNFSNFLLTNVGNMTNRGVELTLRGSVIKTDDVEWSLGTNFTLNRNEVTKLLKTDDPNYPGVQVGGIGLQRFIQNIQVGYPANTYLVFKQVYDSDGNPVEGLYEDKTGLGGDVTANENNKYRYNNPQPDFLIGINSQVRYKDFDFSFSGRLSVGNYVYNNVMTGANYSNFYYTTGYFNNLPKAVRDTEFMNAQPFSDYYIENASFFKMDNISLGYSANEFLSPKLKARFSLTVQNAFIVTDYSGIDPEVNGGIDNNIYPRPRVFMLGVNLTY